MRYLNQTRIGEHVMIINIETDERTCRRLKDMGFIHGTDVVCVGKSVFSDPRAYRIRDTVIALRNETANKIQIK